MSRIARRDMLKAMAATTAGAAISALGGSTALAARTSISNSSGLQPSDTTPRVAFTTTPGVTYSWLWGPSDFTTTNSTDVWSNKFYGLQSGGSLWGRPDLPHGATLTEVNVSLIVNDANSALVQLGKVFPWSNSAPVAGTLTAATPLATVQNLPVTISPLLIDNSQFNFIIYYAPGTPNSLTHQLMGVRFGWINNPGLNLFPDPRRIINGGPFVNGAITGPYDATLQYNGTTPTGIPAGARAAFCAVQSYTPGVLTLFPDLTIDPGIANYSGTGNLGFGLNMIYMMVPLSAAGKFKIHSYISGNCYVDAWGYVI